MRPTFAEIRLRSLLHNYGLLEANVRAHAGESARLIAVIKANAYGHGLALCGRALAEAGAGWLGVTSVDEAMQLRGALGELRTAAGNERARVLVMSGFWPGEEGAVLRHGLTAQVWEGYHFGLLDAAARRMGLRARSVGVHLEIDTGMSRQGVAPGEALRKLLGGAGFERGSPVWVEGVLTHFSSPENEEVTQGQMERFGVALGQLGEAGVRPRWVHAGNSVNAWSGGEVRALAALARGVGAAVMVRPGLALYGVGGELGGMARAGFVGGASGSRAGSATEGLEEPMSQGRDMGHPVGVGGGAGFRASRMDWLLEEPTSQGRDVGHPVFSAGDGGGGSAGELEPVLCWKSEVTSLREVGAGTTVGYNETFRVGGMGLGAGLGAARGGARLGLVPVGYADGFRRELGNRGVVLVGGRRAPVVGRVSMDQMVVDVSGVPGCALGDEVVLLGAQGGACVSAGEMAGWCGTIAYEVLCGIGVRVGRVGV